MPWPGAACGAGFGADVIFGSEAALTGLWLPGITLGSAPNGRIGTAVDEKTLPPAPVPPPSDRLPKPGVVPPAPDWPELAAEAAPGCAADVPELVPDPPLAFVPVAAEPPLVVPEPLPDPPDPVDPPGPVEPLPEPAVPPEPVDPPEPPVFDGAGLADVGVGDGDVGAGDVQVGAGVGVEVVVGVGVGVHAGVLAADAGPPSLIKVRAASARTTAARISPLAIESPIGRRFRMLTRRAPLLVSGDWLVTVCRHIIRIPRGGDGSSPLGYENDGIADPV